MASKKFIPGSDANSEDIFDFVFLQDEEAIRVIHKHGRIMFIVRGPPGTGKNSLRNMIKEKHSGIICSADDYFSKTFNPPLRSKSSLPKSHEYCHKRVLHECTKGTHPIIVSNTHMKKSEMQVYLNLAMEYGYTVIMAITSDKFKFTPEILERSNSKGLTKDYFINRLKNWQDVYPVLTAWFLCLNDSYFILQQLKYALKALLEDGKFCRIYNMFDKDELYEKYQCNETLFSVAGYSKNSPYELKKYYKSSEVKASIGKSFKLLIEAFVITKSDCFAAVEVGNDLQKCMFEPKSAANYLADQNRSEKDVADVLNIQSLSLQTPDIDRVSLKTIPLTNNFSEKCDTVELGDNTLTSLNGKIITFIPLAQREKKAVWKSMDQFRNSLTSCTNSPELLFDLELEDGFQCLRLPNEAWLVKLPKRISVSTIFTGLYI